MLTVGDIIQVTAHDLDYQGQGVARHDDYVIFVKGLLSGEEAEIKIDSIKKRFAEASVTRLIERSPLRTNHVLIYGSADLMHLSDEGQRDWQVRTTKETFRKIAGIEIDVASVIESEPLDHYRNKSVFHVMSDAILTLGLYAYGKHELVQIRHFVLGDKPTNQILKHFTDTGIYVDSNALRHVVIRTNPMGSALVTLVASTSAFYGLDPLVNHLKKLSFIQGITLNIQDQQRQILGDESLVLFGENGITEPLGNSEIRIDDRAFFQINPSVSKRTYDHIKDIIPKCASVIDAYCGVGSIGFHLKDRIGHLVLIDSNESNMISAQSYLDTYGIQDVELVCDQAEDVIEAYDADCLIVDPPRQGLKPKFVDVMIKKTYPMVVYLSCDLKTLARDIAKMMSHYEIHEVHAVRMFPQTTEIETLVILNKKNEL